LKDLNEESRLNFIAGLNKGTQLYTVGFEREPGETKEGSFMKEFGVKLVRGVTLTSEVTKNDENYYSVKVEIDPVQYRDD
jgi:hypothetical protein